MAEDLGEDPPVLQPPIQRLVTCPYPPLHRPILCWIRIAARAFDFVRVATVPLLVGLDPLSRLEEVPQNLVENIYVDTYRQGTAPGSTPGSPQGCPPPALLVGREGVPLRCGSLLEDADVRAVDCYRAVVEHVVRAQPAFKVDLRLRGGGRGRQRGGMRTRCWEKKTYA